MSVHDPPPGRRGEPGTQCNPPHDLGASQARASCVSKTQAGAEMSGVAPRLSQVPMTERHGRSPAQWASPCPTSAEPACAQPARGGGAPHLSPGLAWAMGDLPCASLPCRVSAGPSLRLCGRQRPWSHLHQLSCFYMQERSSLTSVFGEGQGVSWTPVPRGVGSMLSPQPLRLAVTLPHLCSAPGGSFSPIPSSAEEAAVPSARLPRKGGSVTINP